MPSSVQPIKPGPNGVGASPYQSAAEDPYVRVEEVSRGWSSSLKGCMALHLESVNKRYRQV